MTTNLVSENKQQGITKTPLLKEIAYEAIKTRFISHDFCPGTFFSERTLARQLGMSKTPVKAALERLESEGFITVSPQQGIMVRELSIREIVDIYEIRSAMESFVLKAIAGKLLPGQVNSLRESLDAQGSLNSGTVTEEVALDSAFHGLFITFLGNIEIQRVTDQLRDRMERVIRRVFNTFPDRYRASLPEHQAIAEAVIQGDGDLAARLAQDHLERGKLLLISPGSSV